MNRTIALIAGGLAFVVAACGTAPEVPQDQYFRLSVATPQKVAKPALPGVVSIERFSANGLAGGRPMVYTRTGDANRLSAYHYQFWIETPPTMLRDLLVSYLRSAGVAGQVVTPELRVEPGTIVRGRIQRFEQIVGAKPGIAVELEVTVQDVAADRILHLRTYRVERPTRDDTVAAAVEAFGAALSEIFASLVQALTTKP